MENSPESISSTRTEARPLVICVWSKHLCLEEITEDLPGKKVPHIGYGQKFLESVQLIKCTSTRENFIVALQYVTYILSIKQHFVLTSWTFLMDLAFACFTIELTRVLMCCLTYENVAKSRVMPIF